VKSQSWGWICLAALVLTLSNGWKPLVVDDPAYARFADQIASRPGDPYGFQILWRDRPEPANHLLAPPVVPYWIAAAKALFGDQPLAWKLWLFPFSFLLAASAYRLSARLAPGRELLVVWMLVLAPGVLSGFNLMTDVPALALGLFSLAIGVEAVHGGRIDWAMAAGVVAALAMQTKYTSAGALVATALYALLHRRVLIAACVVVVAGLVFCGWEYFVLLRYGESHLGQALAGPVTGGERALAATLLGVLCILGATCPAIALLCLVGLRVRIGVLAGVALLPLIGAACIALLPAPRSSADYLPGGGAPIGPEAAVFASLGLFVLGSTGFAAVRLLRRGGLSSRSPADSMLDRFLVAWIALEIVSIGILAPFRFLAARRILGLVIAGILFAARSTCVDAKGRAERVGIGIVLAFAAAYGAIFHFSDYSDALTRRRAVARSIDRLQALGAGDGGETTWFTGHWSFGFYAERSGLQPVIPETSQLERGDWLLVPIGVSRQGLALERDLLEPIGRVAARNDWPWSTIPSAYIGMLPLRRQPRSQVEVQLYRVNRDFIARSPARAFR
jgi:hypothetical protein